MERGRNHDVLLIRAGEGGGGAGRNRDVLLFRAGGGGGGPRSSLLRSRDVLFFRAVCVYCMCPGVGGVHGCVCADSLDVLLSSLWWP